MVEDCWWVVRRGDVEMRRVLVRNVVAGRRVDVVICLVVVRCRARCQRGRRVGGMVAMTAITEMMTGCCKLDERWVCA